MIILNVKDGLGNQMFEYAFARMLQIKSKEKKLHLNSFFFNRASDNRSFSLNHFRLNDNVVVLKPLAQWFYSVLFVVKLFLCYPYTFFKWVTSNQRPKDDENFLISSKKGMYVHFNTFHTFNIFVSSSRLKFIYGNYESYLYFKDIIDILQNEFQIISPQSEANAELMQKICSEESVCVHIRRGDYLNPKWSSLQVCDEQYFQNGMDLIRSKKPDAVFYIFSNTHEDIEWIKANYNFPQDVFYVDNENTDYEELHLMMSCRNFVISNSTFSWWAAVLASNKKKLVVVPEKWVKDQKLGSDYDGLYLPEWIKMSVNSND